MKRNEKAKVVPLPGWEERNDEARLLFALLTLLREAKEVGRRAAESHLRLCEKGGAS